MTGKWIESRPKFCFADSTSGDKVHFDSTEINEIRVRRFVHDPLPESAFAFSSPTRRCVMSKEVFLRIKANNVSSTCLSVNVSRLAVGSSKIRIGASLMIARADSEPLAFSAAQPQSLLADQCVVAFGQSHDKVMDLRSMCCRLRLLLL